MSNCGGLFFDKIVIHPPPRTCGDCLSTTVSVCRRKPKAVSFLLHLITVLGKVLEYAIFQIILIRYIALKDIFKPYIKLESVRMLVEVIPKNRNRKTPCSVLWDSKVLRVKNIDLGLVSKLVKEGNPLLKMGHVFCTDNLRYVFH